MAKDVGKLNSEILAAKKQKGRSDPTPLLVLELEF
jgi:hypothetical protein